MAGVALVAAHCEGRGPRHAECVGRLLAARAPVDAEGGRRGRTALQLAVLGGHRDVAQILLNRGGAKAGKKDANGQSALTMALRLNRGMGDAELVGALEFANQTRGAAEVSGLRFN